MDNWEDKGDYRVKYSSGFTLQAYYTYTGWYGCCIIKDNINIGTPELFDTMQEAQTAAEHLLEQELAKL